MLRQLTAIELTFMLTVAQLSWFRSMTEAIPCDALCVDMGDSLEEIDASPTLRCMVMTCD